MNSGENAHDTGGTPPPWWAEGLLFENCNCQIICPAHLSFKQNCTFERCLGYWAIRFEEGTYGEVPLGGLMALLTLFMLVEKIAPAGRMISRSAGVLLVLWGGWMMFDLSQFCC